MFIKLVFIILFLVHLDQNIEKDFVEENYLYKYFLHLLSYLLPNVQLGIFEIRQH